MKKIIGSSILTEILTKNLTFSEIYAIIIIEKVEKGKIIMAFDFVRDRFYEARQNGDSYDIKILIDEMKELIEHGETLLEEIEKEFPNEDCDDDEDDWGD